MSQQDKDQLTALTHVPGLPSTRRVGLDESAEIQVCTSDPGLALCTVVIPAYNAENWVERTLRSVAQQTYPHLEVLVIDDGSTDRTRSRAESVTEGDARFRVISIKNGGVANARNVGIAQAKGEFVAFLDADDLWHPDKIALQVAAMGEMVDGALPAASYTLSRSIDVEDRVSGLGNMAGVSGYMLVRHLYFKPVGNGSSLLVRRNVALEMEGFDPSWAARGIGGCEDLDFELKVAARYPIASVRKLLTGYRKSPGNMSSNHFKMARGYLGVVERHLELNPQIPAWAKHLVYASTFGWTLQLLLLGRHWTEAVRHLKLLFRYEPRRAIRSSFEKLFFSEPLRVLRLMRARLRRQVESSPTFAQLSPEIDRRLHNTSLSQRDRRVLERLTALDRQLWEDLQHQQKSWDSRCALSDNAEASLESDRSATSSRKPNLGGTAISHEPG